MEDGRIIRTRSILEEPEERRWCKDWINKICGQPWTPARALSYKGKGDGPVVPPTMGETDDPVEEVAPSIPRGMGVQPHHFEKYGFSEGCKKCYDLQHGVHDSKVRHNPQCRTRIIDRETSVPTEADRITSAETRRTRYLEQVLEQNDAKESKRRKTVAPETEEANPGPSSCPAASSSSSSQRPPAEASVAETTPVETGDLDEENILPEMPLPDAEGNTTREREVPGDEGEHDEPAAQRRRLLNANEILKLVETEGARRNAVSAPVRICKDSKHKFLICEAFSPPRVADKARSMGKAGG